jgi:lysophospholipase L1-like esterase
MVSIPRLARHLARAEPIRILAIGSSSTEGIGASSKAKSYPAQLQSFLRARWKSGDVTVENAGIGGETAVETVSRLEAALRTDPPDLVIWQVGTNDALKSGDENRFRDLLSRGISAARNADAGMILLDQQFFPSVRDPARYERYVQTIRDVAAVKEIPIFPRYALMKEWAKLAPREFPPMLSSDGFHMSDQGYACLAWNLGTKLAQRVEIAPAVAGLGKSSVQPVPAP